MDGTNSKQWALFLSELNKQQIDFDCIQHADESSRTAVLNSIPSLSPLDRAVISSTWAKLSNLSNVPHQAADESPLRGGPLSSSPQGGNISMLSSIISLQQSAMGGGPCDVESLRTSLNRGDCATALPLASELLQQDAAQLCSLLHEYLPHISVEQLRVILGVGTTTVPNPSAPDDGRPLPLYGSSASQQGAPLLNTSGATLNNTPINAGQVLTSQALTAQFGPGFTATCNGMFLSFPYCVQKGDHISVRPMNTRHL